MKTKIFIVLAYLLCYAGFSLNAQITLKKSFNTKPVGEFTNASFCILYTSYGEVLNLRNFLVAQSASDVTSITMNPAKSSYAVLMNKNISIYSYLDVDKELFNLKDKRKGLSGKPYPVAMCYSPDSRTFVASNTLGEIIIYNTKDYIPTAYIQADGPASLLAMSSNNHFIAAAIDNFVVIYNFETHEVRTSLEFEETVTGITFSPDALQFAVTTMSMVNVYETKKWEKTSNYDLEGLVGSPSFHPEGKYLAVVKNNNSIPIINLKNYSVEQTLDESAIYIKNGKFFKDNGKFYIISDRVDQLVVWDANGLSPFFAKELNSAIDDKMNEWVKMMEGETMEEYAIRVNDETRLKQHELFAQEIATEMAGDRIAMDSPFVGEYDAENSMLNIEFNALPPIALEVPEEEKESFANSENLTFSNAVYTLNENDEFVLAYVEVLNETTNKVYIFDNIGRTKLDAINMEDEGFIPLEIMQQISLEEVKLQEIKQTVVEEHTQDNLITDNTKINVTTDVVKDVDANGNDIFNYKIGYEYEVINMTVGVNDDFPSGSYNIRRANAAKTLVKIIKGAFDGEFAKYLEPGKKVKITITGSADASPIRGKIAYNGMYGEYVNEPYYNNGDLDNITLTQASGITSNQQLAFARGLGLKTSMENDIEKLKHTKNQFEYQVKVSDQKGGQFRRISVEVMIYDAFKK